MNRLRQAGDSDYDVLGVSPGATEEEINSAFRRLIDGQGYKVGVPLNRQWLRARQIKEAHANLADPAKRRAYDESLGQASGPAPWVMTANDPATDELVLQESKSEAAEPVESGPFPIAAVPPDPAESAPTGSEPGPVRDRALEPAANDDLGFVHDVPAPQYVAPTANDDERASVRRWGVAAAAAVALGLVLLPSWSGWVRQSSTNERPPGVIGQAWQASEARPGLDRSSAQAPGNANGAGASNPEDQDASPDDSATASDGPGQPSELRNGGEGGTTQAAGELVTNANRTPAGTTGAAAGASPGPMEAAGAGAVAPTPAPPAPAIADAPVGAGSSDSPVRSPAQWIGGGPTNADNPRGRYQGSVAVQVTVEPDGHVSSCAPVRGSGNAGLDALTCRLVQERARFSPALDGQGRPVASQAYTTFVWGRRQRK